MNCTLWTTTDSLVISSDFCFPLPFNLCFFLQILCFLSVSVKMAKSLFFLYQYNYGLAGLLLTMYFGWVCPLPLRHLKKFRSISYLPAVLVIVRTKQVFAKMFWYLDFHQDRNSVFFQFFARLKNKNCQRTVMNILVRSPVLVINSLDPWTHMVSVQNLPV